MAAAGGDLLEVSRLDGLVGRDLEFSGLEPIGEPPAAPATAWADLRSVTRGGTQLAPTEDALPGEAGSEPLPLSMEDEDWMLWRDCPALTGTTEQVEVPEVEMGDGVEAWLPANMALVSGTRDSCVVKARE